MTFDEQVASLRGKVAPKIFWKNGRPKKKLECTPAEWAARLDYKLLLRDKDREKYNHKRREQRRRNLGTVKKENASERAKERKRRHKQSLRQKKAQREFEEFFENPDRIIHQFLEGKGEKTKGITATHVRLLKEHFPEVICAWQEITRGRKRQADKEYADQNREQLNHKSRTYKRQYPEKVNAWFRRAYQTNPAHKIRVSIRNRVNSAVKYQLGSVGRKPTSAIDCGCSVPELMAHLERQFEDGMSWANWTKGVSGWHIDHIYPLAKADLKDDRQYRAVCHYKNLRPMWGRENFRKQAKVTSEQARHFEVLLSEIDRQGHAAPSRVVPSPSP
jgi:hypothetical protein